MKKRIVFACLVALMTLTGCAQTELKKVYDEGINPMSQIDDALSRARAEGKFVVCQVGGNWCPWCLRFADFITNDSTISQLIDEHFVYIHVNYNPRKSASEPSGTSRLSGCVRNARVSVSSRITALLSCSPVSV